MKRNKNKFPHMDCSNYELNSYFYDHTVGHVHTNLVDKT